MWDKYYVTLLHRPWETWEPAAPPTKVSPERLDVEANEGVIHSWLCSVCGVLLPVITTLHSVEDRVQWPHHWITETESGRRTNHITPPLSQVPVLENTGCASSNHFARTMEAIGLRSFPQHKPGAGAGPMLVLVQCWFYTPTPQEPAWLSTK